MCLNLGLEEEEVVVVEEVEEEEDRVEPPYTGVRKENLEMSLS